MNLDAKLLVEFGSLKIEQEIKGIEEVRSPHTWGCFQIVFTLSVIHKTAACDIL